jgi:hypothetical protein
MCVITGCAAHVTHISPPEIERNVQEGFSAQAGFEIIQGENLPSPRRGRTPHPKKNRVTYRLDPQENANEVTDPLFAHIQWVTLVWGENPFLYDVYLHGDIKNPDRLAIRVSNLDIRKFLHPSIASFSTHRELIRLQAYFEEFSRKSKIIYPLSFEKSYTQTLSPSDQQSAQRISDIKIVNNCREPGNYEVHIRDGLGRHLLESSFTFPTGHYNMLLTRFHGVGIKEQGTGIGVPWALRKKEVLRYWDSFLPWNWIKRFPKVTIDALSQIHGEEVSHLNGAIEPVRGRIPYEEYEADREVQMKSRPHWLGEEPLTYIRVDPSLPLPTGFEPPRGYKPQSLPDKIEPMAYWMARENQGKIVPHHFRTFEEIQRYDLFFSEFALNGVYVGKSDRIGNFNWEREEGRWDFHFQYLAGLNRFEMRELEGGYQELRLLGEPTNKKAIHFVMGNFRIDPGESVEFLFGLGTQPLITAYNDNPTQIPLRYAVAYDADGTILDHHDRGIGVEKVLIEQINENRYKVRLISYERILPVWEGILTLPVRPVQSVRLREM